ncbi:MAG: hypothetical protein GF364_03020 [Candidatus Lokiarchaeota archaeon]|nr:hypothetical protein [Candidatus Lokiarchaeota archaeon]
MIKKTNTTEEYLKFDEEYEDLQATKGKDRVKQDIQLPSGTNEQIENVDEYKEFDLIINTYRLYKEEPSE